MALKSGRWATQDYKLRLPGQLAHKPVTRFFASWAFLAAIIALYTFTFYSGRQLGRPCFLGLAVLSCVYYSGPIFLKGELHDGFQTYL
ncbi:MAG TPA: hypothetical protein PLL92_01410 [Alicycliphilus sp.]|nr:hypothetical protein [Alicycliphilus sp.]